MKEIAAFNKISEDQTWKAKKSKTLRAPIATVGSLSLKHFRLLKWNEVVLPGDFLAGENQALEQWEGPGGFRADAFLKPVYRRRKQPAGA